jgi:hypothetical protein
VRGAELAALRYAARYGQGGSAVLTRLVRLVVSPEQLYMISLAATGLASLVTIALPAASRGVLAAAIVSATLGAALGSFSIDTFLLSRPAGWILNRGRGWVLSLGVASIALSAAAAAVITTIEGIGSYAVAVVGACALTTFNASGSLAMRLRRFTLVYAIRAGGGAALIAGYAALIVIHDRSAMRWSVAWLLSQLLVAVVLGSVVLATARGFGRPAADQPVPAADQPVPSAGQPVPTATSVPGAGGRRDDVLAAGKLHAGMSAQMVTFRLDQVLLARFTGAQALGIYALAVAAMEFAQASGVVAAQRILADRDSRPAREHNVAPVAWSATSMAVLVVIGLALVGWLVPQYSGAWLLGLLLLPGCIAVAVGKAWNAQLLKQRGELITTWISLATVGVALPAYLAGIPLLGAVGAAMASSLAYLAQAVLTRRSLHRQPEHQLVEQAA